MKCITTPIIADGIRSFKMYQPIPNPANDGIAMIAAITELLANNSEVVSCLGDFLPSNEL